MLAVLAVDVEAVGVRGAGFRLLVEVAFDFAANRISTNSTVTSVFALPACVAPLATSTGAGSASRHSIGTGVIGGMLAATFVAILFVPLFFRLLTRRAASPPHG